MDFLVHAQCFKMLLFSATHHSFENNVLEWPRSVTQKPTNKAISLQKCFSVKLSGFRNTNFLLAVLTSALDSNAFSEIRYSYKENKEIAKPKIRCRVWLV